MRILFLDDDEQRHKLFRRVTEAFKPAWDVVYAWTSQEAEEACTFFKFDIAFLDHDLGEESIHNGSMFATEILSGAQYLHPKLVIVHSSNPEGAANMVSKFRSCDIKARWHMAHEVDRMIRSNEL
jgi:CheY-like chemotaxis protein